MDQSELGLSYQDILLHCRGKERQLVNWHLSFISSLVGKSAKEFLVCNFGNCGNQSCLKENHRQRAPDNVMSEVRRVDCSMLGAALTIICEENQPSAALSTVPSKLAVQRNKIYLFVSEKPSEMFLACSRLYPCE